MQLGLVRGPNFFAVRELKLPPRVSRQEFTKNMKVCFQTINIVGDDFKPHNQIPAEILILLDLSVGQQLPKSDIAIFAIFGKSGFGNFWHTDKSWVSKSISTRNRNLRLIINSDNVYSLKTNFYDLVNSCLVTLEGNFNSLTAKNWGLWLTSAASIFLSYHIGKEFLLCGSWYLEVVTEWAP